MVKTCPKYTDSCKMSSRWLTKFFQRNKISFRQKIHTLQETLGENKVNTAHVIWPA